MADTVSAHHSSHNVRHWPFESVATSTWSVRTDLVLNVQNTAAHHLNVLTSQTAYMWQYDAHLCPNDVVRTLVDCECRHWDCS